MNRSALLIGSPGVPGRESFLPGVERDLENYNEFLLSPLGGAWRQDEIYILKSPTQNQLDSQIKKLKSADYSFVVFSGHGGHSTRRNATIIEICPDVEVDSKILRSGGSKHTLILDCCRVRVPEVVADSVMAMAKSTDPRLHPANCRKYFDSGISLCPIGLVVVHACDIDETAGDTSRGGRYSSALINAAENWYKTNTTDTSKSIARLSIVAAHEDCARRVRDLSGSKQNPEIEKPRSDPYFPFAIVT
jgi:Caspase domain